MENKDRGFLIRERRREREERTPGEKEESSDSEKMMHPEKEKKDVCNTRIVCINREEGKRNEDRCSSYSLEERDHHDESRREREREEMRMQERQRIRKGCLS